MVLSQKKESELSQSHQYWEPTIVADQNKADDHEY